MIRVVPSGSGSRIRILIFPPSGIPDLAVKKAPDHGSGSATLKTLKNIMNEMSIAPYICSRFLAIFISKMTFFYYESRTVCSPHVAVMVAELFQIHTF